MNFVSSKLQIERKKSSVCLKISLCFLFLMLYVGGGLEYVFSYGMSSTVTMGR